MTSSTLYREGDDLDALLAELDAEFPGQVRVVEVSYPREGGVFGFFARRRVGVHFAVDATASTSAGPMPHPTPHPSAPHPSPFADLIAAAEAAEAADVSPATPAFAMTSAATALSPAVVAVPSAVPAMANAEFAAMVRELAAARTEPPAPVRTAPKPPPPATPEFEPLAAVPARASVGLPLRRRLLEIGVPVDWVPSDSPDARTAIEQVARRMPLAPAAPTAAGELLAIVGPSRPAAEAAESLRALLGLDAKWVWTANATKPLTDGGTLLDGPCCAGAFARCHRIASYRPAIVIIATDDPCSPTASRAKELIDALAPDVTWACVDASSKPSDTRRALAQSSAPDALVVSGAARTASPATVHELGIPVAVLDGAPATRARWSAVLMDALAAQER